MQWIKKHIGGGGDSSTPFIIGSDKWMGSTAQHKGEKAAPEVVYEPPVEEKDEKKDDSWMSRSKSFAPPKKSASEIPRSQSMTAGAKKGDTSMYPEGQQYTPESGQTKKDSSMYPKVYEGKTEEELANAEEDEKEEETPFNAREECLVTIPNAIVHLVDDQYSPHLATGHFSLVRITQKNNGIIVLVRVGENLHWPLMQDEPTVKLDPTHYFFSLRVPSSLDDTNGNGNGNSENETEKTETLNYGVTFADAKKHSKDLQELDNLLTLYGSFSSPTVVQGDKSNEDLTEKTKQLSVDGEGGTFASKDIDISNVVDKNGGKLIPTEVVSSDGKTVAVTEQNQSAFWTTMAPNVDDYGSTAARAIATGSGHVIRGIFWVSESTAAQLEKGTIYINSKLSPHGDQPSHIGPRTLRNLKRVRNISRGTENVAKGILLGVVRTAGFFTGSIIKSKAGKKIFTLMPGEVALVSLDAFGKLFDALEKATSDVLQSSSLMTQNVIAHKFGEEAGQVTQETLATAGHVVATAWTVVKLRKAFNPKDGVKPTKTSIVTGLAKKAMKGGK